MCFIGCLLKLSNEKFAMLIMNCSHTVIEVYSRASFLDVEPIAGILTAKGVTSRRELS